MSASGIEAGGVTRYFHGGVPGIRSEILPPERTRVSSTAEYGAERVCRTDRVYLTTIPDAALMFAAGAPSSRPGWVYEVKPVGDVEPDEDYSGPAGESVCARRARIVRVRQRLTVRERQVILRALGIAA